MLNLYTPTSRHLITLYNLLKTKYAEKSSAVTFYFDGKQYVGDEALDCTELYEIDLPTPYPDDVYAYVSCVKEYIANANIIRRGLAKIQNETSLKLSFVVSNFIETLTQVNFSDVYSGTPEDTAYIQKLFKESPEILDAVRWFKANNLIYT